MTTEQNHRRAGLIDRLARAIMAPITTNGTFFVTMYVLGVLCAVLTLPNQRGAHLYSNLWLELFLDDYLVCLILTLIPGRHRIRQWVRRLLYVVLYAVAIVDVYCFWKFGSTLSPSMLLLVGETDPREAREFFESYLSPDVITSPVGWLLLLLLLHVLWAISNSKFVIQNSKLRSVKERLLIVRTRLYNFFTRTPVAASGAIAVAALLVWSGISSYNNKVGMTKLMTAPTVGKVEHLLTYKDHGEMYLPIYRLAFSMYSNHLANQQLAICKRTAERLTVDSCSHKSPTIVLIIGESYGKKHSQIYGYPLKTTPHQRRLEKTRMLTKFTDVVSCWNLTSFVFKNVLSLHVVGQEGDWCDYPLFPEVFRKAGYRVTFLTNQFLPKAKDAVYDFSGGFFLNDPTLSKAQFDVRNDQLYHFDGGLLNAYDTLVSHGDIKINPIHPKKDEAQQNNLIIFHLIGQHVSYRTRCPNSRRVFGKDAYQDRTDLTDRKRQMIADYDNAIHYNDSIVAAIVNKFRNEDAIIIYMPDHGEECYEPGRDFICRNHSAEIDWPLAHYEFEVPFWIYCSKRYIRRHRDVYRAIRQASDKRFMTDALPHLLIGLAGISTKDYHPEYDLLSPKYDEMRPRILKNQTDYDKVRDAARKANIELK